VKKKLFLMKNLLTSIFICLAFASCETNAIYKSIVDIKDSNWYIKEEPTFTFEVADETIPYNIYILVRNSSPYAFNNLYLNRYIYDANKKPISIRLEEMILFDPKTGKPLGDGLGDIFDHKFLSNKNFKFPKKGKYTIKLKQYMRQDPLQNIMSVGISVEKSMK
jgi:gliding motility-associated lipoprotein GldH